MRGCGTLRAGSGRFNLGAEARASSSHPENGVHDAREFGLDVLG